MDQDLYLELQRANKSVGIVRNFNAFECVICLTEVKEFKGVVLRDCLHEFCDMCLVQHIKNNLEAEIKCPFVDTAYSCPSVLRQTEVKSIVSPELYKKLLYESLKAAEMTTANSFHCQTPSCIGWCVLDGSTREFVCPICAKINCTNCEAIHENKTCYEHSEAKLKFNITEANKLSKQVVDKLIFDRKAMICPHCKAIIEKIAGCDGLQCTICKTQLCWATRGLRWGPRGQGDMTGGCHCNENGKRCDPNCNNCH